MCLRANNPQIASVDARQPFCYTYLARSQYELVPLEQFYSQCHHAGQCPQPTRVAGEFQGMWSRLVYFSSRRAHLYLLYTNKLNCAISPFFPALEVVVVAAAALSSFDVARFFLNHAFVLCLLLTPTWDTRLE